MPLISTPLLNHKKVKPSLYSIAIEVNHNKPKQLARLATRFTKVAEQEVEEVYQWRLARWQLIIIP